MPSTKRYPKGKQRLFTNDLKSLLFAFGDSPTPNIETIHALEDCVTSYLIDLLSDCNKLRKVQKRTKFNEHDLKFALRHDPVKLGRVHDLAKMSQEISKANKMFDVDEKAVAEKRKTKVKKEKKKREKM